VTLSTTKIEYIAAALQMEAQSSQQTQVIEIGVNFPDGERKSFGEAPCGFADIGSISKDSEERSTFMRKLLMAVILFLFL